MSADHLESGYEGDLLAHPLAGVIAGLDGTKADSEGRHNLAHDVLALLGTAGRPRHWNPHQVAVDLRGIREHLAEAERMARALPTSLTEEVYYLEPAGMSLAEQIARTGRKLASAEAITADLCNHYPADQKKRRNEIRDRVALACGEIFLQRKGATTLTAAASADHREAANKFSGFVYEVFQALDLMDTPTAWFRPADKAAKALTAKQASK